MDLGHKPPLGAIIVLALLTNLWHERFNLAYLL